MIYYLKTFSLLLSIFLIKNVKLFHDKKTMETFLIIDLLCFLFSLCSLMLNVILFSICNKYVNNNYWIWNFVDFWLHIEEKKAVIEGGWLRLIREVFEWSHFPIGPKQPIISIFQIPSTFQSARSNRSSAIFQVPRLSHWKVHFWLDFFFNLFII